LSSQVINFKVASDGIALERSQTSPFTSAANTLRAKPSLIDFAMSNADEPDSYERTAPSGNVMFILCIFNDRKDTISLALI
jgi:hypothetical protein